MISKFSFPTTIHFGPGARRLVAEHLEQNGVKRPLIVTDKGLAALPILKEFGDMLTRLSVGIFPGVYGNPTKQQVNDGVKAFKAHQADAVIGFGGGAALDVAKAVALMAVHEGDVLEYAWDHPKVRPITQALPYFIALPTTIGTGSDVGRTSVISHDQTHVK
jgi:alcohol dehydrogenase class IV